MTAFDAFLRRLTRLERDRITYRKATVTAVSPLTVAFDNEVIPSIPRLETAWVPEVGQLVSVRLGPGGPVCEGRYV